jgi:hypothetical protein
MALYGFEESDRMPVEPWSVQVLRSIVSEVASPIAEFWDPNVETE